jgi:hypothetical protein
MCQVYEDGGEPFGSHGQVRQLSVSPARAIAQPHLTWRGANIDDKEQQQRKHNDESTDK